MLGKLREYHRVRGTVNEFRRVEVDYLEALLDFLKCQSTAKVGIEYAAMFSNQA